MDTTPKKIGEGGYGCIHNPNLTCANNPRYSLSNNNTLSKILKTKHANIEMTEYKNMSKADPSKKYYLGDPVQCKISPTKANILAIGDCDEATNILKNLDEYSLLIMEYGGINLRDYGRDIEAWAATAMNKTKIERFWLESHRLLRGVKMLLSNGLIHSDFKPHNIVYDEKKKRLNFIDFGLMQTLESTKHEISEDNYRNTKCHFSHPFESVFLSKFHYDFFTAKDQSHKEEYYRQYIHDIEKKDSVCGKKINDFFKYIFDNSEEDKESKRKLLEDHVSMLRDLPPSFSSWNYMTTLNTFDIYGIGFTYLYMLKSSKHLLDSSTYYDMRSLFLRMISGNAKLRPSIDDCLREYEAILLKHGLLDKFNVHFQNHIYYHGKLRKTKTVERLIDKMTFAKSKDNGSELEGDLKVAPRRRQTQRLRR